METINVSKSMLRTNQKVSYWRGFWVGIFVGLLPATFFFVLLQKLINVNI